MTCPSCDGTGRHDRPVLAALTVRTCTGCGLRTSDIRSSGGISYAEVDDAAYEAAIGTLRRRQVRDVLRFAMPHARRGEWLDIGCGPGYLLAEARGAGFAIRGIEPDAKAAALARTRLGDVVRHDTFREAEQASTDVVSTLDVLEHVPVVELAEFAARVRDTLRPGGVWVIKVPSSEGLFFRVAHALRLRRQIERLWQVDHAWPHTVYFDRATLGAFLRRNGFDVVAHRYLAEVPLSTAVARLTMLGDVPRWQALLGLPAIAVVNAIEALRRKSDALVMVARPR